MSKIFTLATILLLPIAALAQGNAPGNFKELIDIFLDIIGLLVPAVFALTFIVIVWGITKAWILGAGSEENIQKGKKLVFVGVFALVIMSGIWGILAILRSGLFG
jgi:hypothetical protein